MHTVMFSLFCLGLYVFLGLLRGCFFSFFVLGAGKCDLLVLNAIFRTSAVCKESSFGIVLCTPTQATKKLAIFELVGSENWFKRKKSFLLDTIDKANILYFCYWALVIEYFYFCYNFCGILQKWKQILAKIVALTSKQAKYFIFLPSIINLHYFCPF